MERTAQKPANFLPPTLLHVKCPRLEKGRLNLVSATYFSDYLGTNKSQPAKVLHGSLVRIKVRNRFRDIECLEDHLHHKCQVDGPQQMGQESAFSPKNCNR